MLLTPRKALLAAIIIGVAACGDSGATNPGPNPNPNPNPQPAPVASVTLAPAQVTLTVGETRQLTATARDANNQPLAGKAFAYATSAPTVAAVAQSGVVTAVAEGEATITVTSEGKTASAVVTVQRVPVAEIEISPDEVVLEVGGTAKMTAVTRDANDNVLPEREVQWIINRPNIATVDPDGTIRALAVGNAMISAVSEGKSSQAGVRVVATVARVEIAGALDTLEAYDERYLTTSAYDVNNVRIPNVEFTWTTSNPQVATVDAHTGLLTGIDRGTVQVTATAPNGKSATVTRVVVIKYRSVTLGTAHACDIASGGIAWCWGLNSIDGRLGLAQVGDGVHRTEPHRVPGDHKFVELVTYARHTCGLRNDGKAYCWGTNNWGALGAGTNVSYSSTPVAVAGNHTFVKLVAGIEHACGLTPTGTMMCWGRNDWGQFGTGNTTNAATPIVAAQGMVFASIGAGSNFSCGINALGNALCWGGNSIGQLGDGGQISYGNVYKTTPTPVAGGNRFAQISGGESFTCALDLAGAAYCWGSNQSKLGSGNSGDTSTPRAVSGGLTFRALDSGFGHSCALTTADEVYCWGSNSFGQIGAPGASALVPTRAANGIRMAEVNVAGIGTGSGGFTCAISKDRLTTYCWGRNDFGQLGNGATNLPASVNTTATVVVGQKPL